MPKRKILIMGGGLGLLPESPAFYQAINGMKQAEFTVITGKNEKLLTMLQGKYDNITAVGYTDQVPAYMKAADAVVTKPGGITIFEAIAAEAPLLLLAPYLQQEKTNAVFVEAAGIGTVFAKSEADMLWQLAVILESDTMLEAFRERMQQLKAGLDHEGLERIFQPIDPASDKSSDLVPDRALGLAPELAGAPSWEVGA